MNRYSTSVNMAVERSSSQSPAKSNSKSTTIKSPVSKSGGNKFLKNPETLPCSGGFLGGVPWGGSGGGQGGSGLGGGGNGRCGGCGGLFSGI